MNDRAPRLKRNGVDEQVDPPLIGGEGRFGHYAVVSGGDITHMVAVICAVPGLSW